MPIFSTLATIVSTPLTDGLYPSLRGLWATPLRHRAVREAYARFAVEHEAWTKNLFDLYLLQGRGDAIIAGYMDGQTSYQEAASKLAAAWLAQLPSLRAERRERLLALGTTAAKRFLSYLHG